MHLVLLGPTSYNTSRACINQTLYHRLSRNQNLRTFMKTPNQIKATHEEYCSDVS